MNKIGIVVHEDGSNLKNTLLQREDNKYLRGFIIGYLPYSGVIQFLNMKTGSVVVGQLHKKHDYSLSLSGKFQCVVYEKDINIWFVRHLNFATRMSYSENMDEYFNEMCPMLMDKKSLRYSDAVTLRNKEWLLGYITGYIPMLNLFEMISNDRERTVIQIKIKDGTEKNHDVKIFEFSRFDIEFIESVKTIGNVYTMFESISSEEMKRIIKYSNPIITKDNRVIGKKIDWISEFDPEPESLEDEDE